MIFRCDGGTSLLWFLCFFLIISREALQTVGCGGCSGSSERGGLGGLGDLTGILIGFLLARSFTSQTSSVYVGSNRAAVDPPLMSGNPGSQNQKLNLSPETVSRIETLRKENGFGFLWGAKAARALKKMAENVGRPNATANVANGGQTGGRGQKRFTTKVRRSTSQSILATNGTSTVASYNVAAPLQDAPQNLTSSFNAAELAAFESMLVKAGEDD